MIEVFDVLLGWVLIIVGALSALVGIPVFMAGVKSKSDLSMLIGSVLIGVSVACVIVLFSYNPGS